jgi:hypothetical protein
LAILSWPPAVIPVGAGDPVTAAELAAFLNAGAISLQDTSLTIHMTWGGKAPGQKWNLGGQEFLRYASTLHPRQ